MQPYKKPPFSFLPGIATMTGVLIALGTGIAANDTLAAPTKTPSASPAPVVQHSAEAGPHKQENSELKDIVEMLGVPVTIMLSIAAYITSERWKHRQYVEEKVKAFESQLETINIRKILSTELQCVELFPFVTDPTHRFVLVKDCIWAEALLECKCNLKLEEEHRKIDKNKPLDEQDAAIKAAIRDQFNQFLNELEQFEKMIQSRAVRAAELINYLEPWVEFINSVNEQELVECSIGKRKYTPKQALLEYMGLITIDAQGTWKESQDDELSVTQRKVKSLIKRYCKSLGLAAAE